MKYLLDTSALLAHVRGEPEARQVQELFDMGDAEILTLQREPRGNGKTSPGIWSA